MVKCSVLRRILEDEYAEADLSRVAGFELISETVAPPYLYVIFTIAGKIEENRWTA